LVLGGGGGWVVFSTFIFLERDLTVHSSSLTHTQAPPPTPPPLPWYIMPPLINQPTHRWLARSLTCAVLDCLQRRAAKSSARRGLRYCFLLLIFVHVWCASSSSSTSCSAANTIVLPNWKYYCYCYEVYIRIWQKEHTCRDEVGESV